MDSLDLNKDTQTAGTEELEKRAEQLETPQTELSENATPAEATEPVAKPKEPLRTKEELVAELRSLINQQVEEIKEQVESLKQTFYKIYNAEQAANKQIFLEKGGLPEDYTPVIDEAEQAFKQLLAEYKKRKAEENARLEREKEQNLLQKQHILEQMRVLIDNNSDISANLQEFKQLQQKWKEIGAVPAPQSTGLWKQYNLYQEQFYDLVKINNELREYDFRKNLEAKTALCEAAEKLGEMPNVVEAFRELQKLHDEWKTIGPVARELRDEIWARFQAASAVINKKHQEYFQTLHQAEDENLQKKTALCEKLESIDYNALTSFKLWEEKSEEVMAIQAEWRTIGFAPHKVNKQIYSRYRELCDEFFNRKAAFYKEVKNELAQNLEKKRSLCAQAEALKESTDWKETTDKLIALQKEWKTIGPVAKKYSDDVWKRFLSACDYFFDRKKQEAPNTVAQEQQNLSLKKDLIARMEQFEHCGTVEESVAAIRAMINEFNAIGFVPFKEKDKIYKQFREAVDKQFDALNVDKTLRKLDTFRSNLQDMQTKGENKLLDERRKLLRVYDNLKAEIAISENNIGFFSAKSKKSENMLKEMERKINSLKEELRLIETKIGLIDEKL